MQSVGNYKCMSCGASLRFEPQGQNWKCDYCRSVFSKADLDKYYAEKEARKKENDGQVHQKKQAEAVELDVYHCKNCGAEIVGGMETLATFCLYCKSPTIIKARMQGNFSPRYIIPFRITQKQAVDIYGKWIKSHFLAPKEFKSDEEIEKIRGVYAPFWLYHAEGIDVAIQGVGQTDRVWRSGNTEYTETSHYNVVRTGKIGYNNVPVDASTNMEDELMSAIEPYQYSDMVDFSSDYMTGFFAERYDLTQEELVEIAKERMRNFALERLQKTIHYHRFHADMEEVDFPEVKADYGLLPVYILTNIYQGKAMQYVMNGQTGKIYGEVPISKAKLGAIFGGTFFTVWILYTLFVTFF